MEIIKFFNNHSFVTGVLRAAQRLKSPQVLSLILPVITRWTSHFLALRRFLEVKEFIKTCVGLHSINLAKCGGRRKSQQAQATALLSIVQEEHFWVALEW